MKSAIARPASGSRARPCPSSHKTGSSKASRSASVSPRADLSCEVSGNHVDRCGFGEPVGLGIIAAGITGELSIKFNEVRDIGLDPSGASKSAVAIGIGGLVILTASVEGNFVTYTNLAARPVDAEDRALVMMGMSEFLLADRVFGFPITIGDNKFYGAGKSALVELRQTTWPICSCASDESCSATITASMCPASRMTPWQQSCSAAEQRPSWATRSKRRRGFFRSISTECRGRSIPGNVMAGGLLSIRLSRPMHST